MGETCGYCGKPSDGSETGSDDGIYVIQAGNNPKTFGERQEDQTVKLALLALIQAIKAQKEEAEDVQENLTKEPKKAQKVADKAKKVCCVCGKKDCAGGRLIQDNYRLCEICASTYIATVPGATESDEFFLSHGPDFFKDALAECCNPYRNISFNFKTKKIYLKDAMRKKNYKVVSFSDLIGFRADVKADMGYNAGLSNQERFRALDADFRYNGTTVRYHIDDSLSETKGQVFDEIVDCFTRVQNSSTRLGPRQSASISSAAQIQNSSIHHAQVQQSSACGSPRSSASPYQFRCPYCGGTDCTPVVETSTTGKNFSTGKACCGSLFFWNPAGLLCGFCGKGKQTTSTTYWMCHTCGSKFQK